MTEVQSMDALKERILENIAREQQLEKSEEEIKEEKRLIEVALGKDLEAVRQEVEAQNGSFGRFLVEDLKIKQDKGNARKWAGFRITLAVVTTRCEQDGVPVPQNATQMRGVQQYAGVRNAEKQYEAWLKFLALTDNDNEASARTVFNSLNTTKSWGMPGEAGDYTRPRSPRPELVVESYHENLTPEERQAREEAHLEAWERRRAEWQREHEESGGAAADDMWERAQENVPTVRNTLTPEDMQEINEKYREKPEEAYAFDIGSWARRLDRIKPEEVAAFLVEESRGTADIALSDADTIVEWHQAFRHAVYRKLNEGLKVVSLREEQQS